MKIEVTEKYGIVPNSILYSPSLSFKAKGLYAYIQAKPDDWDFSSDRIKYESKDGKEAIQSALRELEEVGILKRIKDSKTLKIDYLLSVSGFTAQENPAREKPAQENTAHIYTINNKTINNKTTEKEHKAKPQQLDILSEEIYQYFIKGFMKDKTRYFRKAQTMLYLSALLKEYDSITLIASIDNYKKQTEPKYWMSPQYFFSNSRAATAKHYRPFIDYLSASPIKEKTKEEIKDISQFF